MKYEKSCGVIAYKIIDDNIHYLIIQSKNGDVGFPKGHVEEGETEILTAIRELKEETNVEVEIIDGFRNQIEYPLPKKPDTQKQAVYYLGKCISDRIICQKTEVDRAEFISYNDALEALTFESTKKVLKEAHRFICKGK